MSSNVLAFSFRQQKFFFVLALPALEWLEYQDK
jgi:hypothetical protein